MMQITEVQIGGLLTFIESDQYKRFHPKPITELRAISQYNNPDANAEDTALILAHEEDEVIGFVGLLPRKLNGTDQNIYSNSCWWVNKTKGKGIALPLFLKALKKCNSQMYLTDCTSHTKSILEQTGLFNFADDRIGVRAFMRVYFADYLTKKHTTFKKVKPLLDLFDSFANLFWAPKRLYYLAKYRKQQLDYNPIEEVDEKVGEFILAHSENEFTSKTPAILNWIKTYPWLKEISVDEFYEYPFSFLVNKYKLDYFTLEKEGEFKGFVAFSIRDNLLKIPFLYFDRNYHDDVMNSIFWYILNKKIDSVITFHPAIINYFKSNKIPLIFKKDEIKITGTTNELSTYFSGKPFLQDGDGDVVFT